LLITVRTNEKTIPRIGRRCKRTPAEIAALRPRRHPALPRRPCGKDTTQCRSPRPNVDPRDNRRAARETPDGVKSRCVRRLGGGRCRTWGRVAGFRAAWGQPRQARQALREL